MIIRAKNDSRVTLKLTADEAIALYLSIHPEHVAAFPMLGSDTKRLVQVASHIEDTLGDLLSDEGII